MEGGLHNIRCNHGVIRARGVWFEAFITQDVIMVCLEGYGLIRGVWGEACITEGMIMG